MAFTDIEHYKVDPRKVNIPDKGLGEFLCGFTEEHKPFNWANIWWNLLPITGQFFFIFFVLWHWWVKSHPRRILLYKNGFIKQNLRSKGRVKKERIINFYEIKGVLYAKTRQIQSIYGIRRYNGTAVEFSVLNSNNVSELILKGMYRNKEEVDSKYNFIGYACNAINNVWIKFAIDKFNNEISSKGYGTFTTTSGEVHVGRDFIKVNDAIVTKGFKYSFDNGCLCLYPNAAEGIHFKKATTVVINVAGMYNKEVFLMAISQLHGIR